MDRPIRVVLAAPAHGGRSLGARALARRLREAGMEVIDTGAHDGPERIVGAVVREDADVVALSTGPDDRPELVPEVLEGLRSRGADDVLVLLGGGTAEGDADALRALGVGGVLAPDAPLADVVQLIRDSVPRRRQAA